MQSTTIFCSSLRKELDIQSLVFKFTQSTKSEGVKMLDAYIIEQIRKREEERRRINDRPVLELPLPLEQPTRRKQDEEEETEREPSRVIIIDL